MWWCWLATSIGCSNSAPSLAGFFVCGGFGVGQWMFQQSLEKALASWAQSNAYQTNGEHLFACGCQARCFRSKGTLQVLATELQATKWLHTQASRARMFSY